MTVDLEQIVPGKVGNRRNRGKQISCKAEPVSNNTGHFFMRSD